MSFADKRLTFGGAGPGTPWGTLGEVTRRVLDPLDYEVRIEPDASRGRCPGLVSAGKLELGATQGITTRWAYAGLHRYAAEGPYPRLRVIATLMFPAWLAVAVRWETGITDLRQVAERRLPLRVLGGTGELFEPVLKYYGLSRELIESWGGRFQPSLAYSAGPTYFTTPFVRAGDVDLIMDNIYAAYTPEMASFQEASALLNLRYLDFPDDLVQTICRDYGGEPGFIPYRLFRGVDRPVRSVYRPWQLIFGRDDMPDDFAYLLAKTYDEHRDAFRQTHIPYSYDPREVARDNGIPLHPGAAAYYRERGDPPGMTLSFEHVRAARERQQPYVRHTPTERSEDLSAMTGREVYLKLENLQQTGAFKIRGAISRLLTMDSRDRERGVVTASAGNHGQGVALAAKLLGAPAIVVLPVGAPLAKIAAIQRHGAEVVLEGASYDNAHEYALEISEQRGQTYIHAFADPGVMAGQGAVALEVLEDVPDLDALIVPVGGGGLIAGMATGARGVRPDVKIIGVQAAGSSALAESFRSGRLETGGSSTIADGIAVRTPSQATFAVVQQLVDDVVTVSDEAIARTIVLLLERQKLLAEGAGAAALTALIEGAISPAMLPPGARVCAVVSGGNIDPNLLGKVLQHGMASAGRYLALRTWLDDRPGELENLTHLLAVERINILHVGIHRLGPYTALGRVGLDLIVETRDRAHAESVLHLIRQNGYPAEESIGVAPPDGGAS